MLHVSHDVMMACNQANTKHRSHVDQAFWTVNQQWYNIRSMSHVCCVIIQVGLCGQTDHEILGRSAQNVAWTVRPLTRYSTLQAHNIKECVMMHVCTYFSQLPSISLWRKPMKLAPSKSTHNEA